MAYNYNPTPSQAAMQAAPKNAARVIASVPTNATAQAIKAHVARVTQAATTRAKSPYTTRPAPTVGTQRFAVWLMLARLSGAMGVQCAPVAKLVQAGSKLGIKANVLRTQHGRYRAYFGISAQQAGQPCPAPAMPKAQAPAPAPVAQAPAKAQAAKGKAKAQAKGKRA